MLRSLLDCLTFMANSNFLGREAPWEKINRPGANPWERENETNQAIIQKQKGPIPDYQQQKYQSTEDAWAAMLEKEQSALDAWADKNNNNNTRTNEQQTAPGSERSEDELNEPRKNAEKPPLRPPLIPYSIIPQEYGSVRRQKILPSFSRKHDDKVDKFDKPPTKQPPQFAEVKRSWPEQRQKFERRMTAANYGAVEIHGFFGLIDDGSDGAGRMLVVHVPRWVKGFFLDIKQGDTINVYHARGLKIGAALTVLSTGRHKYYSPGRKVTTCTICVPEEQWAPFASYV